MKIGVFDSGIGGKAIAEALKPILENNTKIILINDQKNIPYGDKTASEIIRLTDNAIQPLLKKNCDIIIIACNTATATAIDNLREKYPNQKFVGIEPMIKPASKLTKSKIIAVCATPATLASPRYKNLVKKFGAGLKIIEPNCSNWAKMIENGQIDQKQIAKIVNNACNYGADIIVLGCTHYCWIKDLVTDICAGRAKVLEPSAAIGYRVKKILESC